MPTLPVGPFVQLGALPQNQQALAVAFSSPGGGNSGTWGSKTADTAFFTQEISEFCAIQEGSVEITVASGGTFKFVAGDCFLIPKGLTLSWNQVRWQPTATYTRLYLRLT
jgi:uncharacterized cupin superfamily protein